MTATTTCPSTGRPEGNDLDTPPGHHPHPASEQPLQAEPTEVNDPGPGPGPGRVGGRRAGGRLVTQLERLGPPPAELRWWAVHEPALAGLATFDDLRRHQRDRRCPQARKDARLAALLRLTLTFGNAPAEAVLALMVPGMATHVRIYARGLDRETAWAAISAGLYERIRLYAPNPPTPRVASNLLWPATNTMITAVNVERSWATHHGPLDRADQPAPDSADDLCPETLLGLAVGAGVLSPADVSLIAATRFGGLSLPNAARLVGIGAEAAKKRRQRAEARWLAWWDPELAQRRELRRRGIAA